MTSSAATIGSPVGSPPTIGVLGRDWRATVSPWGSVQQWDGLGTLEWFVAGDDRWYVPSQETTVRQSLVEGTPVVETRVRIPKGDVVQRVYAVADHGGLTIVEVENDSPMPIAVAFSGVPVLSSRAPSNVPLHGADLPAAETPRQFVRTTSRPLSRSVGASIPGRRSGEPTARRRMRPAWTCDAKSW